MADKWGRTVVTVPDGEDRPVELDEARTKGQWDPVWGRTVAVTVQTWAGSKPKPPLQPFAKRKRTSAAELLAQVRAERARRQEMIAEEYARAEKRKERT